MLNPIFRSWSKNSRNMEILFIFPLFSFPDPLRALCSASNQIHQICMNKGVLFFVIQKAGGGHNQHRVLTMPMPCDPDTRPTSVLLCEMRYTFTGKPKAIGSCFECFYLNQRTTDKTYILELIWVLSLHLINEGRRHRMEEHLA